MSGILNQEFIYDSTATNMDIRSSIWSNPEDFNAAVLRHWIQNYEDTDVSASVSAKYYDLGVKHIGIVENFFEKDFYVSSVGRTNGNNTPTNIIKI